MKKLAFGLAAIGAVSLATPAFAAVVPTSCTTTTTPAYTSCVGDFTGQILDNGAPDQQTLQDALSALGVSYTQGTFGSYTTYDNLNGQTDLSSLLGLLTGTQVIGVHYGGGAGGGITDIYKIDFGTGSYLSLNLTTSSSLTIFSQTAPVPEPATWAMMLLGFSAIGFALRRRGKRAFAHAG
jgi:hypothetical protein